jgi:hypothetical protein
MARLSIGNGRIRTWIVLGVSVVVLVGASPGIAVASGAPAGAGTTNPATVTLAANAAASVRTACVAGAAACPIRIRFAAGAYAGQARSRLTGINAEKWFVVNARAGQEMIVIVKGAGATRGTVHFPNGQQDGQPGGRVFDDTLPVSGDYRIRVTESLMGEAWNGRVDVIVVIF